MDGSSKAGLESTSTWVGWFFFFSVRVVTVTTINVLREVLRDGCHLLRVQKALVFHAGEEQCAIHDLVGKGAFGQGAEVQVGIQHTYISFAERFLRSERLPSRPHTGSSVWFYPLFLWCCGSFAYSFSVIYIASQLFNALATSLACISQTGNFDCAAFLPCDKNAVRVPPERRLEKVLYGFS